MVIPASTSLVESERNSDPNCLKVEDNLFAHIVEMSRITPGYVHTAGCRAQRLFLLSLLFCVLLLSWFQYQVPHDSKMAVALAPASFLVSVQ